MKRIFFMVLFLFITNIAYAIPFNQIIFFGDSLSDNGNLYRDLFHVIPKSPPYFRGRFSNGQTWAEHVGKYFYDKYYVDYQIYAVGGATAASHLPKPGTNVPPFTINIQLDKYIMETMFKDHSKVLAVIWIGGNDYLFEGGDDADVEAQYVVNGIESAITRLAKIGIKNFMILNLPDLGKIPMAEKINKVERLSLLSKLHNQKLPIVIQHFKNLHADVSVNYINIDGIFKEVLDDPEKFNKKYNVNITDTANACWEGKYWLKNSLQSQQMLSEMQRFINKNPQTFAIHPDWINITKFIQVNPSLAYTYALSNSYDEGNMPCGNASEHLFWDDIHPSETVHSVLAKMILEHMQNYYAA